mmetsp:Transcript_89589/g.179052  ORF Transcript_89589/g.179052 Transcript_89589/m.179052 type:complete len:162 (-) Transcript_89589:211-696(-)
MEHPLFMLSNPTDKEFESNDALNALASLIDGEGDNCEINDSAADVVCSPESLLADDQRLMCDDQSAFTDGKGAETSQPSLKPSTGLTHLQQTRPLLEYTRHTPKIKPGISGERNCSRRRDRDSRAVRRPTPYTRKDPQQTTSPKSGQPNRQKRQRPTLGQV